CTLIVGTTRGLSFW
nr:immunoglobulin heavy chain junction region [Macaca mulatta]